MIGIAQADGAHSPYYPRIMEGIDRGVGRTFEGAEEDQYTLPVHVS